MQFICFLFFFGGLRGWVANFWLVLSISVSSQMLAFIFFGYKKTEDISHMLVRYFRLWMTDLDIYIFLTVSYLLYLIFMLSPSLLFSFDFSAFSFSTIPLFPLLSQFLYSISVFSPSSVSLLRLTHSPFHLLPPSPPPPHSSLSSQHPTHSRNPQNGS